MNDRQTRIEQALAFGRSDQWITAKIGATAAEIKRVRAHLEEVAGHRDDPEKDVDHVPHNAPLRCKRGHPFTPDNILRRHDDRIECRTCKQNRDRDYGAKMRAHRRAA